MLGKIGKWLPERRESQAALEFLMTYGWAILVVLVAVVALAYFGVLSPDRFLPEKCILPPGITCLDYKVESYQATLVLQNTQGYGITVNEVKILGNNQECSSNVSTILKNNEKLFLTITQCNNGPAGNKFYGTVNVSFTLEDRLTHNIAGTLNAKIAEGSSLSSQTSCQNAQDNGLCDGLDIVYGVGYKAACCSEHSLCC